MQNHLALRARLTPISCFPPFPHLLLKSVIPKPFLSQILDEQACIFTEEGSSVTRKRTETLLGNCALAVPRSHSWVGGKKKERKKRVFGVKGCGMRRRRKREMKWWRLGEGVEPLCPGPFHFPEFHLPFHAEHFRPDVDASAPSHQYTHASTRVYVHCSIPF